ncbi:MAG: signal peptidase I [Desulfobulbaceae bacterium]|nr:signal peptidase I [Desulfobulbaceae bacterium]
MKKIIFLFILFLILVAPAGAERVYTVAGLSMSPSLVPGDNVVVQEIINRTITREDLVAISFKHRKNPMIKRVVAVFGDTVSVKDGALIVNGRKKSVIDPAKWQATIRQLERYKWTIPNNTLFVLGDSHANSRDSRRLGLISQDQVIGRVVKIIKATNN